MFCAVCGGPVFESERSPGDYFHDVHPRFLATIAREVTSHAYAATSRREDGGNQAGRSVTLLRLP